MLNCNGVIVSSLKLVEEDLIHSLLTAFSIQESIRLKKNNILFLEEHYFRVIATLRRYRFGIPMNYTISFFEEEIQKLIEANKNISENNLLNLHFFLCRGKTQFVISFSTIEPFEFINTSYSIDIYKEAVIASGDLSNLSPTNRGIRAMSKRYAEENGFEDVLLLNEKKNIVESLVGTLYLLQGNQILTPGLESGCQDFTYRSAFNKWLNKKQKIYSLIENDVNPFELQKSEEVMILSLEKGFQCVSNYRKTTYPQRKTEDIFNAFSINFF